MDNLLRQNTAKDLLINEIVGEEFDMFQKVDNIGGRAGCQDDWTTFYVMRYSQASTWSEDTLRSYKHDLEEAHKAGRNMITEKYGYMMEFTDPSYFHTNLAKELPPLPESKANLIAQIVSLQLLQYQNFVEKYPRFAGHGRPVQMDTYTTSIRTYSIGEMKTYSEETLRLLLRDVQQNLTMIQDMQETMASFYGYESLEAAEAQLNARG